MTNLRRNIQAKDSETLLNCYTIMSGTRMTEHERLVLALVTDELEGRGVLVWDEVVEEYAVCS